MRANGEVKERVGAQVVKPLVAVRGGFPRLPPRASVDPSSPVSRRIAEATKEKGSEPIAGAPAESVAASDFFDEDGRKIVSSEEAVRRIQSAWKRLGIAYDEGLALAIVAHFQRSGLFCLADGSEAGLPFQQLFKYIRSQFPAQVNFACKALCGILARRNIVSGLSSYCRREHLSESDESIQSRVQNRFVAFLESPLLAARSDAAEPVSSALLELCATTLPTELPTLLLWGCTVRQGSSSTKLGFFQATAQFLSSADKDAARTMWDGVSALTAIPVPPSVVSLRSTESFEQHRARCREQFEYLVEQSTDVSKSPSPFGESDRFVLLCRWSRADAFLRDERFVSEVVEAIASGLGADCASLPIASACASIAVTLLLTSCTESNQILVQRILALLSASKEVTENVSLAPLSAQLSSPQMFRVHLCEAILYACCVANSDTLRSVHVESLVANQVFLSSWSAPVLICWSRMMRLLNAKNICIADAFLSPAIIPASLSAQLFDWTETADEELRFELTLLMAAIAQSALKVLQDRAVTCDRAVYSHLAVKVLDKFSRQFCALPTLRQCSTALLAGIASVLWQVGSSAATEILSEEAAQDWSKCEDAIGNKLLSWVHEAESECRERAELNDSIRAWDYVAAIVRLTLCFRHLLAEQTPVSWLVEQLVANPSVARVKDGLFRWACSLQKNQVLQEWIWHQLAHGKGEGKQMNLVLRVLPRLWLEGSELAASVLEGLVQQWLSSGGPDINSDAAKASATEISSKLRSHALLVLQHTSLPEDWPFLLLSLLSGQLLHDWIAALHWVHTSSNAFAGISVEAKLLHLLNLSSREHQHRWFTDGIESPGLEIALQRYCDLLVELTVGALKVDPEGSFLLQLQGRLAPAGTLVESSRVRGEQHGLIDFVGSLLDSCTNMQISSQVSAVVLSILVLPHFGYRIGSKVWQELSTLHLVHLVDCPLFEQQLAEVYLRLSERKQIHKFYQRAWLCAMHSLRVSEDQKLFTARLLVAHLVLQLFGSFPETSNLDRYQSDLLLSTFVDQGTCSWVGWAVVHAASQYSSRPISADSLQDDLIAECQRGKGAWPRFKIHSPNEICVKLAPSPVMRIMIQVTASEKQALGDYLQSQVLAAEAAGVQILLPTTEER